MKRKSRIVESYFNVEILEKVFNDWNTSAQKKKVARSKRPTWKDNMLEGLPILHVSTEDAGQIDKGHLVVFRVIFVIGKANSISGRLIGRQKYMTNDLPKS